jgi:hypothetical protein
MIKSAIVGVNLGLSIKGSGSDKRFLGEATLTIF